MQLFTCGIVLLRRVVHIKSTLKFLFITKTVPEMINFRLFLSRPIYLRTKKTFKMQLSGCITNIIVQSTEEQSKSLRFKAQWKLLTSKRTAPSQKNPLLKSHTNRVFLHSRKRSVTAILTATWHVSGQLLHKKPLYSTPIQTLYFYIPVRGQLHLRQPSQKPPLLNSPTNSVFLHSGKQTAVLTATFDKNPLYSLLPYTYSVFLPSRKRPTPVKDTFLASRGCPFARAPTVIR